MNRRIAAEARQKLSTASGEDLVDYIFSIRFDDINGVAPDLLRIAMDANQHVPARTAAIEVLGLLKCKGIKRHLVSLLQDEVPEVRFWAIEACWMHHARSAIGPLKRLAEFDRVSIPDWGSISQAAAHAIYVLEVRDD